MWSSLTEWLFFLLVVWMAARLLSKALSRPSQPAEPDDYADVPASLSPRPRRGAGAIALAEPDADDEGLTVHPHLYRRDRPR